jgi:hypothetical protein
VGQASRNATKGEDRMSDEWEYKYVRVATFAEVQPTLNRLYAEGWETANDRAVTKKKLHPTDDHGYYEIRVRRRKK